MSDVIDRIDLQQFLMLVCVKLSDPEKKVIDPEGAMGVMALTELLSDRFSLGIKVNRSEKVSKEDGTKEMNVSIELNEDD